MTNFDFAEHLIASGRRGQRVNCPTGLTKKEGSKPSFFVAGPKPGKDIRSLERDEFPAAE